MKTAILITILAALSLTARAEDAASIIEKHNRALLTELNTYIEQGAKGEDLATAYEGAIAAAMTLEDTSSLLDLMEGQLKNVEGLELHALAQGAQMYSYFAQQAGQKQRLEAYLDLVQPKLEATGHPQIGQLIDQLRGKLDQAWVGDKIHFAGKTTDGTDFNLDDYKGKLVLVDFWATWCPPCVAEIPNVKAAYEKWHDKGFEVIGISGDREEKTLTDFLTKEELPWPNIYDASQADSIIEAHKITAFPTIYLLDGDGKILATGLRGPALEAALAKHLGAN